jgi:hypothetical protein
LAGYKREPISHRAEYISQKRHDNVTTRGGIKDVTTGDCGMCCTTGDLFYNFAVRQEKGGGFS